MLTLSGTSFVFGAKVFVDGDLMPESLVFNERKIEVYVFPLAAGPHTVKVVNPDGAESNELELIAN